MAISAPSAQYSKGLLGLGPVFGDRKERNRPGDGLLCGVVSAASQPAGQPMNGIQVPLRDRALNGRKVDEMDRLRWFRGLRTRRPPPHLCLLALAACTPPPQIVLDPVDVALRGPIAAPTVAVAPPHDLRPPGERQDGGFHATAFFPITTHGDVNVHPHPVDALDRTAKVVVASLGLTPEAGPAERLLTLDIRHFAARREASDASLALRLSSGAAGTVGSAVTPATVDVPWEVDVALLALDGTPLAQRTLGGACRIDKSLFGFSPVWRLWFRRPAAQALKTCLQTAQDQFAADLTHFLVDPTAPGPAPRISAPPRVQQDGALQQPARIGPAVHAPLAPRALRARIDILSQSADLDVGVTERVTATLQLAALATPIPGTDAAALAPALRVPGALLTADVAGLHHDVGLGATAWASDAVGVTLRGGVVGDMPGGTLSGRGLGAIALAATETPLQFGMLIGIALDSDVTWLAAQPSFTVPLTTHLALGAGLDAALPMTTTVEPRVRPTLTLALF